MKLGFARKDITPSFPVPLAGYMVENPAGRISEGVHDKLYARALYFDDSQNGPFVLLQLDLLCLDKSCVEKIRAALQNGQADCPPLAKENLLVCCVHTHSGFGGMFDMSESGKCELAPLFGKENPLLIDLVVKQSVRAIVDAFTNRVETKVRMNKGTITGLGTNRRSADLPCDNSLFVMEFLRADGKKILLYNLSCHPTVMNRKNLLLSADFPSDVAGKLEDNAYDMVVFVNGSAGDMSTRFTRKESSFDECKRYADLVIGAINNSTNGDFLPLEKTELRYHEIALKKAVLPDPEEAEENLKITRQTLKDVQSQTTDTAAIRKAESFVEGAEARLRKSRAAQALSLSSETSEASAHKTVEAGILTINNTTIVCSPFEFFSTLALRLKQKKQVECFGYVNAYEGYLADCDAFDAMDYEALSSDFERGEGERYIELIANLV
jgi:hypothetical protein